MNVRVQYNKAINRYSKTVKCVICETVLLPRVMNKHVKNVHNVNFLLTCTWCLLDLREMESKCAYSHRLNCIKSKYKVKKPETKFIVAPNPPIASIEWHVPPEEITGQLLNSNKIQKWFEERNSLRQTFGNAKFEIESFYENLNSTYPEWLTSEEGVQEQDLKYFRNNFPMDIELTGFNPFLQRAYSYKQNLNWFHISIRVGVWPLFMDFYEKFKHLIYITVHWCLCKGGKEHHRHMICVWQRQHDTLLSRAFEQIKYPNDYEKCKFKCLLNPSEHPTHLANLIAYVSNIASKCKWENDAKSRKGSCHYWINQPVIPSLVLFCMLYVRNGVHAYLRHKCKNSNAWDNPTLHKTSTGWHCEARTIAKEKYIIFPIPRNCEFVPANDNEQDFIDVGDRKFTVKQDDNLLHLDQLEWNRHQLLHQNCALTNAGNLMFKLGKKQQEILNAIDEKTKSLQQRIHELEQQINNQ